MMPAAITLDQLRAMRDVYCTHQARSTVAPEAVRNTLELQRQILDELINRRELEEKGGWISVEQMLPDEDLLVLVWDAYGHSLAKLTAGVWTDTQTGTKLFRVTAWQELPADYEPDTGAEQ